LHLAAISVGLSILGSLGGVIVASTFLLLHERIRMRLVPWLISYAVGTLIGVALIGLVPEALVQLPARAAMLTMSGGIVAFFLLEKWVLWRHCHDNEACHVHSTAAKLVIVGDAFHTFVDGAVIAAAVLTAIPLAGYSRMRAFTLNVLAGAGGIVGAVTMVIAGRALPGLLPYVLAFAAGNFLYVAMADLIPDLHRGGVGGARQVLLMAAGIVTIALLGS
jgi:zinc and cadmium transporter